MTVIATQIAKKIKKCIDNWQITIIYKLLTTPSLMPPLSHYSFPPFLWFNGCLLPDDLLVEVIFV